MWPGRMGIHHIDLGARWIERSQVRGKCGFELLGDDLELRLGQKPLKLA